MDIIKKLPAAAFITETGNEHQQNVGIDLFIISRSCLEPWEFPTKVPIPVSRLCVLSWEEVRDKPGAGEEELAEFQTDIIEWRGETDGEQCPHMESEAGDQAQTGEWQQIIVLKY